VAVRAVLAAGLATVIIALALVLTQSGYRQAGSNHVPESEESVKLRGGGVHCEEGQIVPKDAAALRLLVGTYGRPVPAIEVTARANGRTVTRGALPAGQAEGPVRVALRDVPRTTGGTRVCVRVGKSGRTVLYGLAGHVRLEWLRPGRESWLGVLGPVAHRFGLAKANPFGDFLLVFAALILAAAWALTARLVLRELRS
jgi:hypothetical protein